LSTSPKGDGAFFCVRDQENSMLRRNVKDKFDFYSSRSFSKTRKIAENIAKKPPGSVVALLRFCGSVDRLSP
jgi:hypothetical protein